jgi:hypothetical protein
LRQLPFYRAKVDRMLDSSWAVREVEARRTAYRSVQEYQALEYPHESLGWLLGSQESRPKIRRRSVVRTILRWVGLAREAPSHHAD